jgi:hypothetical protein
MSVNVQTNINKEIDMTNKIFQAFGIRSLEAIKLPLSDATVWN